jgi:hypothetical protein
MTSRQSHYNWPSVGPSTSQVSAIDGASRPIKSSRHVPRLVRAEISHRCHTACCAQSPGYKQNFCCPAVGTSHVAVPAATADERPRRSCRSIPRLVTAALVIKPERPRRYALGPADLCRLTTAFSALPTDARPRRLPCASWVSRAPLLCRVPCYTHHIAPFRCNGELSTSIGAPTGSCVNGSRRSTANNEAGPSRAPFGAVLLSHWGLQSICAMHISNLAILAI